MGRLPFEVQYSNKTIAMKSWRWNTPARQNWDQFCRCICAVQGWNTHTQNLLIQDTFGWAHTLVRSHPRDMTNSFVRHDMLWTYGRNDSYVSTYVTWYVTWYTLFVGLEWCPRRIEHIVHRNSDNIQTVQQLSSKNCKVRNIIFLWNYLIILSGWLGSWADLQD